MANPTGVLDTAESPNGLVTPSRDSDDPGRRGSLLIKDRAVQRIAEAAALAVTGVDPSDKSTNVLNSALGRAYP